MRKNYKDWELLYKESIIKIMTEGKTVTTNQCLLCNTLSIRSEPFQVFLAYLPKLKIFSVTRINADFSRTRVVLDTSSLSMVILQDLISHTFPEINIRLVVAYQIGSTKRIKVYNVDDVVNFDSIGVRN